MARRNTTGLTPEILRPAAAPVDIFARTNAGQQLSQLAEGLSTLSPSLSRYAEITGERSSAQARMAGENRARQLQEEGKTYAQAVKEGLIEPHQSPWFRLGAYETFGRVAGNHYADELEVAFAQSDAAQSSEPSAFDAFERQYRKQWAAEKLGDKVDPYMESAFGKTAEERVESQRASFARQAGAKLVQQTGEAFHAEVFQTLARFRGGEVHAEELGQLIKIAQDRQHAVGVPYQTLNQLTASAITAAAKRFNDTALLDVLDEIKAGSGTLAGTSYGSKMREEAENEIATVNQSRANAEYQDRERRDRVAVEGITSKMVDELAAAPNPSLVDIRPYLAAVSKIDPSKATTFLGMRDAFAKREYNDDPEVKSSLLLGIHTSAPGDYGYTTQAKLDRALAGKTISPATYSELSAQIKTRDKEDNKVSKLFNDDGLKDLQRRTRSAFVAEFGGSTVDQRLRAESAVAEATDRYLRWRQSTGANAEPTAVNEWINHQVEEQFQTKGDKLDVSMVGSNIPAPQFGGPKRPNVEKAPAADPAALYQLRSEFEAIQQKRAKGFSSPSVALLRTLGIPADPKAIKQFLDAQAQFLGSH